jgi:hypothetical protein
MLEIPFILIQLDNFDLILQVLAVGAEGEAEVLLLSVTEIDRIQGPLSLMRVYLLSFARLAAPSCRYRTSPRCSIILHSIAFFSFNVNKTLVFLLPSLKNVKENSILRSIILLGVLVRVISRHSLLLLLC